MSLEKIAKTSSARHKSRESALQMLFAADLVRNDPEELTMGYWNELGDDADEKTREFGNELVLGTLAKLQIIDDRIRTRAEHWRIERMAIVDRNVLRLAVYEFLFSDTPNTVVINEALEIARRFSTFEATQFINGILDAVKHDLELESPDAPSEIARKVTGIIHINIFKRVSSAKLLSIFLLAAIILAAGVSSRSQSLLPNKIRGYKVYKGKMNVGSGPAMPREPKRIPVIFGEPVFVSASIGGISFDLPLECGSLPMTGSIDLLSFDNFRVNDIAVDVEDYRGPIAFRKDNSFELPRPARIFVSSVGVLGSVWNEFRNSKDVWKITGRVLVFGQFRKMGMKFKRVVPINVNLSIKNPIPY